MAPPAPETHAADARLAQLVRARDEKGLVEFASRMDCIPRFLATLNRRVGSPLSSEDLGDLCQDACVLVMRSLPRYEARASLDTWAWHVCRGALMNRIRTMRRQPKAQPLEDDVPVEESESLVAADELHQLLDALGPPEADVIRLKLEGGLRFREIGGQLGISPNTAKTQYYRGIRWLQKKLGVRARESAS